MAVAPGFTQDAARQSRTLETVGTATRRRGTGSVSKLCMQQQQQHRPQRRRRHRPNSLRQPAQQNAEGRHCTGPAAAEASPAVGGMRWHEPRYGSSDSASGKVCHRACCHCVLLLWQCKHVGVWIRRPSDHHTTVLHQHASSYCASGSAVLAL